MVEQEAVNFEVASSSLAGGAIFLLKNIKNTDIGAPRASLAGGAIKSPSGFFCIKKQARSPPSASVRVWPGEPFFLLIFKKRPESHFFI